ncbi:MAG: caspase family protein [Candidatus Thorarchaeota archaeon]
MLSFEKGHALVIGIANAPNWIPIQDIVLKDAEDVESILKNPKYCGYPEDNVKLLLDSEATKNNIKDELKKIANKCERDSTFFFYISSHGHRVTSGEHSAEYFVPYDGENGSSKKIAETCISDKEFGRILRDIRAVRKVTFLDCCHSGGFTDVKKAAARSAGFTTKGLTTLSLRGGGTAIMTSSGEDQRSFVSDIHPNSVFTHHLLQGIKGGVISPDGLIRISDLYSYVSARVAQEKPEQEPCFITLLKSNFPIALNQGGKEGSVAKSMSIDDYEYDVYISYSPENPDKKWVRNTFLPMLEKHDVTAFIDFRDRMPGSPKIDEISHGIQKSRYTLAVLSPSYLDNAFNHLESGLARYLGIEEKSRRYLAFKYKQCDPPADLAMLEEIEWDEEEDLEIFIETVANTVKAPTILRYWS